MDLPDPGAPGDWSIRHKDRLDLALREIQRYERTSRQIADLLRKARRNRFHLEILAAINDFQVAAPGLLIALQRSDEAGSGNRRSGMEEVEKALEAFNRSWGKLKSVYSRTRFIAYPEGHVEDRYHHFASQREDLTWMIQVEEQLHQKVRAWLENLKK
jgi:hypothetical protein